MDQRVQRVNLLIQNNLHRNLSLGNLASSVNLSPWRLGHLFKEDMGTSPAQYLKLLRMQEAKRLLETTPLSVKEVMARVGIRDKSHFERDFKKAFGLTPAQYKVENSIEQNFDGRDLIQTSSKIRHHTAKFAIKFLLLCSMSCNILIDPCTLLF